MLRYRTQTNRPDLKGPHYPMSLLLPFDQLEPQEDGDDVLADLMAQAYFVARELSDQPIFLIAQLSHRLAMDLDPEHATPSRLENLCEECPVRGAKTTS